MYFMHYTYIFELRVIKNSDVFNFHNWSTKILRPAVLCS